MKTDTIIKVHDAGKKQAAAQRKAVGKAAPLTDNRPDTAMKSKQVQLMRKQAGPGKTIQQKKNTTGLPDHLKSGVENLSGLSMDNVKVHYNSSKPAQLHAHAYAQGTDIHIAPGQEKHLPHEAWHVVQQAQGRVKPTMQLKNHAAINDDSVLEREADIMGQHALIQRLAIERKNMQPVVHGSSDVAQLFPFGLNLGSLPGFFIMSEGVLSIAAGALLCHVNPWQGVPTILMGGTKFFRGLFTMYNSRDGRVKEDKEKLKKITDGMRGLEVLLSGFSLIAGSIATPEEERNATQIMANAVAVFLKLVRSILHFYESEDMGYIYSMLLQVVESLEGVMIIVAGANTTDPGGTLKKGGGLSIGVGTSKVIRGAIAGTLAVKKGNNSGLNEESVLLPGMETGSGHSSF